MKNHFRWLVWLGGLCVAVGLVWWLLGAHDRGKGSVPTPSSGVKKEAKRRPVLVTKNGVVVRVQTIPRDAGRLVPGKKGDVLADYAGMAYNLSKFATLDETGRLTPESVKEAGLTGAEKMRAQGIFDEYRGRMASIMLDHMSEDRDRSDPGNGVYVYSIEPFGDAGAEAFKKTVGELDDYLGEEKSRKLLSGYSPAATYFGHGASRASVKVYPRAAQDGGGWMTETILNDPVSGREIGKGIVPVEAFNSAYGTIFQMD